MNAMSADFAAIGSVAVWVLPALLYAATSDTLVVEVQQRVLDARGRHGDHLSLAGLLARIGVVVAAVLLWLLRLVLAPVSTVKGARGWVVDTVPVAPGRYGVPARPELPAAAATSTVVAPAAAGAPPAIQTATTTATSVARNGPEVAATTPPDSATSDRHEDRHDAATSAPGTPPRSAATKPPRRRRRSATRNATTPRRSMDEWVDLAGPVFHAKFTELRRQPTATEFAAAIRRAGHGPVSEAQAKKVRAEVLDRTPLPELDAELDQSP
jgi:hypothetical protein